MKRSRLTVIVGAIAIALVVVAAASAKNFPGTIMLPNGWFPEGIEAGRGTTLYVSSIPTGAVRQVNARTGRSFTLVDPMEGRSSIGIEYDRRRNRLFVAGGDTGQAYVYNARTGAPIRDYTLTPAAPRFINDLVLTRNAVYFTESMLPVIYRLPLRPRGGLPAASAVQTIQVTGDYVHQDGFNLNGIVATNNGNTLIVVQLNTGFLFKVDPATGVADRIELTGGDAANGDGLLLEGRRLYVVQNTNNRVAVIRLAPDFGSGTVRRHLTNPKLDVPTTIDRVAGRLYLPNARFGVEDPATAEYQVINLGRR
jgi:streptogramin lyase